MSTHRLLLVRHAKAVSADDVADGVADHGRPLTRRGRADAEALGDWLAAQGLVLDLVLRSDALRARQTWDRAAGRLTGAGARPLCRDEPRLFEASVARVLQVVSEVGEDVGTLAVVGHEPTTSSTATALAGPGSDGAELARLRAGFPTASVAVLQTDMPWEQVQAGCAALTAFVVPRG